MDRLVIATITFLVVLALLPTSAVAQCPITCTNCTSSNGSTCNNNVCISKFINTTATTCIVNDTEYAGALDTNDGTLSLPTTASCGTLFPNLMPGKYSAKQQADIYVDAALMPHYSYRVVSSILFVGKWVSADTVSLYVDNVNKTSKSYGGSNTSTQSFSQTCGDSQGGSSKSIYARFDTGDISHTAASINISMVASKCNGCSSSCQCDWFIPHIMVLIRYCDVSCLACTGLTNTTCSSCDVGYSLSGTTCDSACLDGYYNNPNGSNICLKCNSSCEICVGPATNCTVCKTGFILYPIDSSCLSNCPPGSYNDTALTQCSQCIGNCSACTSNPLPCQACNNGWFLFNDDCIPTCPDGLFANSETLTCENCSVYCVNLTINMYTNPGLDGLSPLIIDMIFSQAIDFTTFPMQTFQTITFENALLSLDAFNVTYTTVDSTTYRITLQPKGYSFLTNESITVTTQTYPGSDLYSISNKPLRNESYQMKQNITYTYIRPPSMTQTESLIVSMFSTMSTQFNNFTTKPGVQELKKFGFFLLALNSLQITSCLVLINSILPQNLYEGIRMFASLIFYDVPPWEADSYANKLFFVPPVSQYTRRVLTTQLAEYRFRRTGFSSLFVMDSYSQIMLIVIGYILLGIGVLLSGKCQRGLRIRGYLEAWLFYFHEISILYFTLTITFEFIYFDSTNPVRIASMVLCMLVNLYYFLYHSNRYYDLMRYPKVQMDTPQYDYFVVKYGHMLKNIKYLEYRNDGNCYGFRNWFRPYNYTTVGYVKKFAMMMAFTSFYYESFAQPIALCIIQIGEIVRFCLTWPYAAKWRNIVRLVLEIILLAIFALIYFIQLIVYNLIRGADPVWATWFFMFGWIALGLVFIYNIGFIVLACINLWQQCKYTNRELMDENRRNYYFQKLNDYEENHENVPIELVNEYVKKGNLNRRNIEGLPAVDFRIEYYRIEREFEGFAVETKAIFELFMEVEFNYKEDNNNIAPGMSFERVVHIDSRSPIYSVVRELYDKYNAESGGVIVLKTFVNVEQNKYNSGQQIPLERKRMHQEVTVYTDNPNDKPRVTKLKSVLDGFPVAAYILNGLA